MLTPIAWTGSSVRLLDQTKLPAEVVYLDVNNEKQMHDDIRRLVVRGAPAIGIAGAFGAYLGVRGHVDDSAPALFARLKSVCDYLATSRPTAVNLSWALDRIQRVARDAAGEHDAASPACHVARDVIDAILDECIEMIAEDRRVCRAIGESGLAEILKIKSETSGSRSQISDAPQKNHERGAHASEAIRLLTHCNAGALATSGLGTALAPIYVGMEKGLRFEVYADETRPLLQGSRLTACELQQAGAKVTVICDSMAASVMARGMVDAVIVGSDRIARNGDTANKIGTLAVAIAARHFNIPFFVAAPISTIDPRAGNGLDIPIEQRNPEEITHFNGRATAPEGISVYNPAFDVTPAGLISALITERGVIRPPLAKGIASILMRAL